MTIEDFLARLDGVSPSGSGWVARCPAHGDENASLSVSKGADGKILVHCFAGCTAEAVVASMGLKLSDLMPPPKDECRPSAKGRWGRWVCDYDYEDETGAVVYKVSRYVKPNGKKTFVMKHPDPASKWGWSFGLTKAGVARLPFRLPRVIAAAKAGKTIVFAEGEKDVLNIEALGLAATCNAGGAGKWAHGFPKDWGKWFAGAKKILIIADNDATEDAKGRPFAPGQRHAWDVMRKLHDAGVTEAKIRLMVMPQVEGQAKVKDFTDWREARLSAGLPCDLAAFQDAVRTAQPWPVEWQFDDGGIPPPAVESVDAGKSDGEAVGGRFGVAVPSTPSGGHKKYMVDFRVYGSRHVRLEVEGGQCLPAAMARACSDVSVANLGKLPARMANDVCAVVCLMWLRCRGEFFWNDCDKGFATSMYFDSTSGVLMNVRSDEFCSFVATESLINRESAMFKYIMSMVDDAALSDEVSRGVVPSNLWECVGDRIYISSGDSEMYRISADGVERVQNGSDGVLFMRKKTLKPWRLMEGDGIDPFVHSLLFKGASFADANGRMIVRLWFLNLFKNHRTKPPLLITGRFQSGKTRMAAALKEIIGTTDMSVQEAEDGDKGLDSFWATVNEGMLEVYDNLDTRIKWVPNTLQIAATNGQTKRRTLYTTFGVSVLRAQAHLVITSNNPMFATELGLADRMQSVRLGVARKVSADTELSDDIALHRDEYMTWVARILSRALADHDPIDGTSINMRHPDFSAFGLRLGRAGGFIDEARAAMLSAELDKSILPLQNDPIACEIMSVLMAKGGVWKFTAQEMSDAIVAKMSESGMEDAKTKDIFSCRRIGKTMMKYFSQLSVVFSFSTPRIIRGRTEYTTSGVNPLVGLVGLNDDFTKTPMEKNSIDFSENAPSNPPNPPDSCSMGLGDDMEIDL